MKRHLMMGRIQGGGTLKKNYISSMNVNNPDLFEIVSYSGVSLKKKGFKLFFG